MIISIADWEFSVDAEATTLQTMKNSTDHCTCAYCRNYYEAVDIVHPRLRSVLGKFGIVLEGPSELMPIEPTLMLACYRICGQILRHGHTRIHVDNVPLIPEAGENGTFLIWAGEMELPWLQNEPMEDVISPANQPEFLERMMMQLLRLAQMDQIKS